MNLFAILMLLLLFFVVFLFNLILTIRIISDLTSLWHGAPFVPIPLNVAHRALHLAEVGRNDILYDLGSGDGRVLRLAVGKFGVRKAVGYEVGWWPYLNAKLKMKIEKLKRIQIHRKDFFNAGLSEASVIFLYLTPKLLRRLEPKIKEELSPGSRIICCRYSLKSKSFKIIKKETTEGIPIWVFKKSHSYYLPPHSVTQ